MHNIFFKKESAWHLLYTVIQYHLNIYYLHYPSGVLEDNQLKYTYFDRLQAAVILIKGLLSKYAQLIICFERKNAWSRFALILFKLHEIWLVGSQKIIKIVATRCYILKAKMHQIQFTLRLRPRPRGGSLQRSPRPLRWI